MHAVSALGLNYRVNPFIVSHLAVIENDECIVSICCAALDLPAIERIKKKGGWEPTVRIPAGSTI